MVKIVNGFYGPKLLGPGTVLNLSEADEKRLTKTGVAVYCNCKTVSQKMRESNGNTNQENITVDNEEVEIEIKSEEELNKMRSKKELIEYAESIGCNGLDEDVRKDEIIAIILNYIEENYEVVE